MAIGAGASGTILSPSELMEREWGLKETVRFEIGRSWGGIRGEGWMWVIDWGEGGMDGGSHVLVRGINGSGGGSGLGGDELRSPPSEMRTGGRIVMIGRWELDESTGVGEFVNKMEGRVVYMGTMGVAGSQSIESDTRIEVVAGTKTFQER